jgi:DNA polymerase III alpha subunit (gram-positive type)
MKTRSRCTASATNSCATSRSSRRRGNELIEYLRGAELIIHNAAFDVGFLNKELERAGLPLLRT